MEKVEISIVKGQYQIISIEPARSRLDPRSFVLPLVILNFRAFDGIAPNSASIY